MKYLTSTPYHPNPEQFQPSPVIPHYEYQEPERDRQTYAAAEYGGDDLNKSDSEKVLAKKLGSVNFRTDDLDILYNARGKEIDKLQKQLADVRAEYEVELRSCRHQLALAKSENHNNVGDLDQLQRVVSDTRRENKVLTDEIHNMNINMKSLAEENESLQAEKESSANIIQQLQIQLSQLQSNDSVLKARHQHDATVRSLLERHKEEMTSVRADLDKVNTKLMIQEQENQVLATKLRTAVAEKEEAVRSKLETVTELSNKLTENMRSNNTEVITRLRAELDIERRDKEKEVKERRRLEREVDQLKVEVGSMEALQGAHEDSAAQLGLSGAVEDMNTNQRVRDELHRSLVSNRTKREEISRLEASLKSKDRELELVQSKEDGYIQSIETLKKDLHSASINASQSLQRNSGKEEELIAEIEQLERQNTELKKHISEIVEGNDADKQEAIDELREEYEAHVEEAVQETKSLMENEVKKLRIEIEVYDKTLAELRNKLTNVEEENIKLSTEINELRCKSLENRTKDQEMSMQKDLEAKLRIEMEKDFSARLEKSKAELRDLWKVESKLQSEEAVAAARLEWLKNLPEVQRNAGARESIGELERVKELLGREKTFKSQLETKLFEKEAEMTKLLDNQKILQRKCEESKREGMKEVEETLGKELRETLTKQQEQWVTIVKNTREEAEESRAQLAKHWESQVDQLEEKLRKNDKEKFELMSKERQHNAIIEQMKKTLNEKEMLLEKLRRDKLVSNENVKQEGQLRLLQDELVRRNHEVQRQREEMSSLVSKWQVEMEGIQNAHSQEKQELEEFRSKYHLLKSKVRKYSKHVEAKEEYYKGEIVRLEDEFRNTLEKLKERMELAYSSNERRVETEMGNMRDQLSRDMKNMIRTGENHLHHNNFDLDAMSDKPVKLTK